jgi:hypothetical protein
MKKLLMFSALFAALCLQGFAQSGVSTVIRYGTALPAGAPQWSIFSKIDGTGIFQCTNSPTCSSAGQWVTIGSAGSGTLTGITTAAASGLTGGGLSGTLTLSLIPCGANQILQYVSSSWTCENETGGGGLSGMTAGQVAIAASGTTVTSSEALAGAGAGITTGPVSGTTAGHVVSEQGTTGQVQDSGTALASLAPLASPTFTGTVNGITATMVGLGNVTNNAQTQAAIVPNTAPAAAQILVGNAGGTAYAPVLVSGDSSMTSAGVMTNSKLNGTAFAGTNGHLVSFGAANIPADSGLVAANQVNASSPGVGIAHFAGSTQSVTSSLIAIADLSASGTPSSTTYLRGDNTWATVAAGGLSGMTAGQVAIAASGTTVTSSEALAGAGAGITTGPVSGTTAGHIVSEQGTTGQVQDSGTALASLAPLASPTFTGTVSGITATMVGLGSVTNNAQTQAAIVPNTAPAAAQILVGNAGGTAYAPVLVSGDSSMTSAGVMTNSKLNGTAFSGTSGHLVSFGAANIPADSGLVAANQVNASSPGVGIGHFAGSTQTLTSSLIAIADLSASGTPSSTTFLRGDNTWGTPAGGGNFSATVTSPATTQTVTYNGTAWVNGYGGVTVDPQTGNYTYANSTCPTDRLGEIEFNISAAATLTVPQAGSTACLGNSNAFIVRNTASSTAVLTVSLTTSTFLPEGGSSHTLLPNSALVVYTDATSSTGNYHAYIVPVGIAGILVKTGAYTATAGDANRLIVMNCTSACAFTLPAAPPNSVWKVDGILSIGSTLATVSLNSLSLNGAGTAPTLTTGHVLKCCSTDGSNYFGDLSSSGGSGNVSNTGTPTNQQIGVWTAATTLSGSNYDPSGIRGEPDCRSDAGTYALGGGNPNACGRIQDLSVASAIIDCRGDQSSSVWACGAVDIDPLNPSEKNTVFLGSGNNSTGSSYSTDLGLHIGAFDILEGNATTLVPGGAGPATTNGTVISASANFPGNTFTGQGTAGNGHMKLSAGAATADTVLIGPGTRFVIGGATIYDALLCTGTTYCYNATNIPTSQCASGAGPCSSQYYTIAPSSNIPDGASNFTFVPVLSSADGTACATSCTVTFLAPILTLGDATGLNAAAQVGSGCGNCNVANTGSQVRDIAVSGGAANGACEGGLALFAQENSYFDDFYVTDCAFGMVIEGAGASGASSVNSGPYARININFSGTFASKWGTTLPVVPLEIDGGAEEIDRLTVNAVGVGSGSTTGAAQLSNGVVHITNAPRSSYGNGGALNIHELHVEGCNNANSASGCGLGTVVSGVQDGVLIDSSNPGGAITGMVTITNYNTCPGSHSCVNAVHVKSNFAASGELNLSGVSCGTGTTNVIKDDINGNTMTCAHNTPGAGFYHIDGSGAAFTNYNCADMTLGWCLYNSTWAYYVGGVSSINLATAGSTFGTPTGGAKGAGTINATGLFINGAAVGTGSGSAFPITVSGTVTSGGIPYFSSTTVESSSAILNTNILIKGGGAGGAPINSLVTDNGTLLSYTGTGGFTLSGAGSAINLTGTGATSFNETEGTLPTCTASIDTFWGDSTAHRWKMCNNAGAADTVVGAATIDTFTNKSIAGSEINSGTVPVGQIPAAIPIGSVGSAGLSGTLPIVITSAGVISTTSIAGFRFGNAGAADTVATAAQAATLIQGLTGCNVASNVFTPQASDCVAPGGGSVTSVQTLTGAVVIEAATSGQMAVSGGSGGALTGAADMTYSTHTFATTTNGIFDWSASTQAPGLKLPPVVGGTILAGTSTANLSAPIVIQNTNSTNINTSLAAAFTTPGTSTGQVTVNINGTTTQASLLQFTTGALYTAGVQSGATDVADVLPTGAIQLKGTTAFFTAYSQGSTSASVAPCNAANTHCIQANSAVTSGLETDAPALAQGIPTRVGSASAITDGYTGDPNHAATVSWSTATSVSSTSLCSTTNCPVGTYRVTGYIDVTTACTTTGSYVVNLIYTDDTTVSKTVVVPFFGLGYTTTFGPTAVASTLAPTSTTDYGSIVPFTIRSTGAASINYSTTAGACGTGGPGVGKLYLSVEPIS